MKLTIRYDISVDKTRAHEHNCTSKNKKAVFLVSSFL